MSSISSVVLTSNVVPSYYVNLSYMLTLSLSLSLSLMSGLQRMGAKHSTQKSYNPLVSTPEVLRVLKYIGELLDCSDQPFEGRKLGFAIMGISGLSNDAPEVQELGTYSIGFICLSL